MNAFLSTAILLAGLTQASSNTTTVAADYQAAGPSAGLAISQPVAPAPVVAVSGDNLLGLPLSISPEYKSENVLVVPTPDLPPGSQAELTQDLTVMCRIFRTAVPFTSSGKAPVRLTGDNDAFYGIVLGPMTQGAQALYLDGYGTLFFLHVDYPLVPTEPREQTQAQTPEPADPVWSRTVRELSGQADSDQQTGRNAPTYDSRRVNELTQALIKTLVHCANIRMRRPQDLVTLVIGDFDESRRPGARLLPGMRYAFATTGSSASTGAQAQPAAVLMILRATKADVDTFAKKQLTLEQFTEKVQVLFSPSVPNAPAPSTAPTSVGTRR